MLVITLVLMGGATVAIGCLPTYESVGLLAPILLVALRALQGITRRRRVGWRRADDDRARARGQAAASTARWPQVGPSAGTLLATGAFAAFSTLPEDQFMAWGWRMPFLLSAVVVVIGLVLRLQAARVAGVRGRGRQAATRPSGRRSSRPSATTSARSS